MYLIFLYFTIRLVTSEGTVTAKNDSHLTELDLPAYAGLVGQYSNMSNLPSRDAGHNNNEKNVTGKILKIVTTREPPFVDYVNITNGTMKIINGTDSGGVVIEILEEMRKKLDVQFEFHETTDGQWGEYENGNWTGMIGMLNRKEVDILAGATILRHDLSKSIDQSYPFYTSDTGMLIKSPGPDFENRFLIVTAPFSWEVWALTALTILISGCIMNGLCKAMRNASEIQFTWSQSIWLFFSVFVQQSLPIQPKSWTCRTMLAFWWLAALTLVATFTGNMVALFAVNKDSFPFNNQEELLHHVQYEGYRIVTPNNTLTRIKFIQTSQLTVLKELWHEMNVKQKWINVSTLEEGVKLVKTQPKLVLLGPMETLQIYAAADCAVTTTTNGIIPVMYSIALQKNSPYTALVSNTSRELVETGLVSKWMSNYFFTISSQKAKNNSNSGAFCIFSEGVMPAGEAINLMKAQGAFWILLAGVILGLGSISMEHTWKFMRSTALTIRSMSLRRNAVVQTQVEDMRREIFHMSTVSSAEPPGESVRAYQPALNYSDLKFRKKTSDQIM